MHGFQLPWIPWNPLNLYELCLLGSLGNPSIEIPNGIIEMILEAVVNSKSFVHCLTEI